MNLSEIRQKIEEVAVPLLTRHNAFLVDLQVRPEQKMAAVQLFVDTDDGITIQQCAEISRAVASTLGSSRTLGEISYRLEVSSPGIDRPLRLLRQYRKNIGRTFKVRYTEGPEEKVMSATLVSVAGDQLIFESGKGESVSLPFERIVESREELPW